jgi:hypothetical protein
MSAFYQRQTCINGHVITSYVGSSFAQGRMQDFCGDCGAPTIVECPACHEPQRGFSTNDARADKATPKAYCGKCGNPYPWTESKLAAARELVHEDDLLSEADKEALSGSLLDLTSENPRTTVSASRFKRIAAQGRKGLAEAIQKTLVDVLSETAKKIIQGE